MPVFNIDRLVPEPVDVPSIDRLEAANHLVAQRRTAIVIVAANVVGAVLLLLAA
jgi:hypothetical protein